MKHNLKTINKHKNTHKTKIIDKSHKTKTINNVKKIFNS